MKTYRYMLPEATFEITPDNGWWALTFNGHKIGEYSTPEAAASDVGAQNTGEPSWDFMEDTDAPESLSLWEEIDREREG